MTAVRSCEGTVAHLGVHLADARRRDLVAIR